MLVFTAEEVWGTRYPDAGSVHLLEWPDLSFLRHSRESGNLAEEQDLGPRFRGDDELSERWSRLRELRRQVTERIEPLRRDKVVGSSLEAEVWVPSDANPELLEELFITSTVHQGDWNVMKTENRKCARCWRHRPDVDPVTELDARCAEVVNG